MQRLLSFILLILVSTPAWSDPVRVVASIEPLSMMARQVLGRDAGVSTLMRPGQSLHGASLTPEQVRSLRDAELVIWLGAEAEPQLAPLMARRGGPDLALLSLDGIHRLHGREDSPHEHGDGGHHEAHATTNLDPHIWLDPHNMARLATALAGRLDGDAEPFLQRLHRTREQVKERLASVRGRTYLSQHDPWGYFARAFGLDRALVASEGVSSGTSARRMVELAQTMDKRGVQCVLAEPDARRALLERLCRGECRLVELDPLGRSLTQAGYTDFLSHLGEQFHGCLRG